MAVLVNAMRWNGQLVAGLEGFVRHYGAFAVLPILMVEAIGARRGLPTSGD